MISPGSAGAALGSNVRDSAFSAAIARCDRKGMAGLVTAIVPSLRRTPQRTSKCGGEKLKDIREYFLRMFVYDHWANRECLSAIAKANGSPEALRRIAHVLSAEKLWLERLRGEPQKMPVWPTVTMDECVALADEIRRQWAKYLQECQGFDKEVEYRNTKGEQWSSRVEDILTHVLMHSTYHRGQVALELRTSGAEPASTDFIHAVRQGFVE